jgi:hypothetical protein
MMPHFLPISKTVAPPCRVSSDYLFQVRLFQNFSFWNSFLEFSGKTGLDRFF